MKLLVIPADGIGPSASVNISYVRIYMCVAITGFPFGEVCSKVAMNYKKSDYKA